MSASAAAISNAEALYGGNMPDLSGDVDQLDSQAQSWMAAQTTTAATSAHVEAGASAAADLITNGYDPDNSADNQQLVVAVAGAVSLVPPAGPVIGAVLLGMYELGTKVLGPLINKLFGYSSTPTCNSSDNWTAQGVLATSGVLSFPPAGTFAGLVVPALGKAYADQQNCNAFNGVPGALPWEWTLTLGPLLRMWNGAAGGTLIEYFVPRINMYDWPGGPLPTEFVYDYSSNSSYCVAGPFCFPEQGPYAFQPLSQVPVTDADNKAIADPAGEGVRWIRVAANSGPVKPSLVAASTVATSMSTGAKVAMGAAIVGASAAAGVGVYALATKQGYGSAWSRLWSKSGARIFSR
jgi:hypothetical protein